MPTTASTLDTFTAWSLTHWLVIFATVAISISLAMLRRTIGRRLDLILAPLTAVVWLAIQLAQFLSDDFSPDTALPLHVSDVTLLAVPVALWTSWRWSRAVVYCWGLALGTLAFVLPDLHDGPARLGFWTFWIAHIVIMAAVVYETAARRLRPTWRDFTRAALLATLFTAMIVPFNIATGHNYGYLGHDRPAMPPAIQRFGAWPLRIAPLMATAVLAMALVTLPWRLFPRRHRHTFEASPPAS